MVKLETETARPEAIRMLAAGSTNRSVARLFGAHPSSVNEFKIRHAVEIEKLRDQLRAAAEEQDHLWIASKVQRVGVLQDRAEELMAAAETAGVESLPELTRTLVAVLHEVAEQLGQLPARPTVNVSQTVVNYTITGVDLEAL